MQKNNPNPKELKTKKSVTLNLTLAPTDNRRLNALCGETNHHLHQIEKYFAVEILNRGHKFQIVGDTTACNKTALALKQIYAATATDNNITANEVRLFLKEAETAPTNAQNIAILPTQSMHLRQMVIKSRTPNQTLYLNNIKSFPLNFGIGPAGTGKTYLAVAAAVEALEKGDVVRIVLVRPAIEAGEKLGFLPGDIAEKVDPYLRPLYDALYEMLGASQVERLLSQNVIEIAPLAFMRGRTLNDAFIILDESQNTTIEQMKMFLTRIGFGSHTVVTGDITQIDLPKHVNSGLKHAMQVLKETDEIGFCFFEASDVVRHPLVQKIISAYEAHEKKQDN